VTDLPADRPRALIPSAVRRGEERVCELPKASEALYCEDRRAASSARERSSAELTGLTAEVRLSSKGTCSSPRAHAELRRRGVACWRWRVARLMRQHGLEGDRNRRRRKKTISDCAKQSTMDPIERHFRPYPCIDRRHARDRTSIRSWQGFASLATIVDLASRRVVCWAVAVRIGDNPVADPSRRPPAHCLSWQGLTLHSDRCARYPNRGYAPLVRANGPLLSLGPTGYAHHYAVAESFVGGIKARGVTTRRPQRSLGHMGPHRVGASRAMHRGRTGVCSALT
jgi:putative transposase